MKWWVGLLALLLVVVFGSLAALYVRTFVVHRAHGIVLVVANGLDLSLLNKARHQAAARGQPMSLDNLDQFCIVDVEGLDQPVPDEAAASTALASGHRVRNGLIGLTAEEKNLDTLIYAAQHAGRSTGLVTTRSLTAPTPLAFYGRTPGRPGYELGNAAELIDSSGIDVILGGGAQYFTPANVLNERGRSDGRDLLADAAHAGYTVVQQAHDLHAIPTWRTRQLLGLFAPDAFTFSDLRQNAATEPSLSEMVRVAVKSLQYNIRGYFLVVDAGQIGMAARHNWTDVALNEVAALDAAIGTIRAYAGEGSLVVVTNNFNLGALDRTRDDARGGVAPGDRLPEWLDGPGGPPRTAEDKAWLKAEADAGVLSLRPGDPRQPAPAVRFERQAEPTTGFAWLAAGGFDSQRFAGFIQNDQIFGMIEELF
jgi:alkaline phosphatase